MTLAGVEIHLHDITENAVKQLLDEISTYRITWDCKRKGVDTLVQNVESLCIGSLGIRSVDFLTYIPQIIVFLVSTNEWEFVWHGIRSLQFLYVLTAVERLHTKAFICLPYQAFLEIRTLEVNLDFVKPLLGGRCRKLGKEFLFVISHNFYVYCLSIFCFSLYCVLISKCKYSTFFCYMIRIEAKFSNIDGKKYAKGNFREVCLSVFGNAERTLILL